MVETSPNLVAGSWSERAWSLAGPPVTIGDGNVEKITVRVDESVAGSLQLFARLRAVLQD